MQYLARGSGYPDSKPEAYIQPTSLVGMPTGRECCSPRPAYLAQVLLARHKKGRRAEGKAIPWTEEEISFTFTQPQIRLGAPFPLAQKLGLVMSLLNNTDRIEA
jgi:hypothetical protein